ncbi:MAG: TRAP transporter small permease subunit [Gammaproteobacteria bacterium]|nr:TRAP transporter small permease subunit [Gammaproteobacteria bacterium]
MGDLQGFGFVLPHWAYWGWLAVMPLILLWLDSKKKNDSTESKDIMDEVDKAMAEMEGDDPYASIEPNALTKSIDWLSNASGVFVALWTVNAVVFYFYEVVMRYIFNLPTIWVHESSYLLFGMQYLLTGAFALLHGSHVRVDIVYVKLPPLGRVGMDILTSIFFFVFALAMLWTSWTFMISSMEMGEISLETWGIQYWPIKMTMFIGSILILLAGVSKLTKDILLFKQMSQGGAA